MKLMSAGALLSRLRTAFPDREFIMRSQGQVRFIRISSRVQMAAAGAATALAAVWLGTMSAAAIARISASSEHAALLDREAAIATSESRVAKYRSSIRETTSDLARRQQFIEQMVEAHIGDLPSDKQAGETVSDSSNEAAETVKKVSAVVPEARGLAEIEAQQIAFVERLTRYADRRSQAASTAIRKLGLNPNAIIAGSNGAEGGPLMKLATAADGSLDPRFQRMGASLARMDALENGLASIPQVSPAHVAYVSSSYGYRSDPFTHSAAFHAGLDFPGPRGSPIYAAAKGKVSFVGRRQGYGNCIEIRHGNGLMTRYAHLSRFKAHVGQKVDAGTVIAAMGSTGRSTGPHLHFEVRINGRPVNPRPFLETARNVQQKAG
ncbi:M23 family metallopeptidase [Novosphingobium sp. HK4-1]|uniref:M23 family metallopeptidase n=2 Tax=Novosphingobium mangrovi (ex Huang et al. 2023) TaxID=2976432 RepID=A0ABT2I8W6_9SPHN|nr:M23 family metallopeptidase [Novosphingobium mangrovi (ex Huang et al. 2023)]MCT2401243.1 M23 family metallopeptidase [Novosphingobium mangrovi (ex Huang et al. 2023)]